MRRLIVLGALLAALCAAVAPGLVLPGSALEWKTQPSAHGVGDNGPVLLGQTRIESNLIRIRVGHAVAFPFRAMSTGRATSISVFLAAHTRAKVVLAGVYADAHGRPDKQLSSGALVGVKPNRWMTGRIRSVSVIAGRRYWLVLLSIGGPMFLRARADGSCRSDHAAQRVLRSLPTRWRSGARRRGCPISAYVNRATPVSPTSPTSPTNPIIPGTSATLPSGVSLQQLDGGPSYYSQFSNATGWDSPNFFPIAVDNQTLGYDSSCNCWDPSQLAAYKAEGVNLFVTLYNGFNQAMINAIAADNMKLIDGPLAPSYAGSTEGGYMWFDELDGNSCSSPNWSPPSSSVLGEAVTCQELSGRVSPTTIGQVNADLQGAHGAGDKTRFDYCQYTKPVAENEGLTAAQATAYEQAGCGVISYDSYVINDGWATNHDLWRQYDDVANVRAQNSDQHPVMAWIEAANPMTNSTWSGVKATPAMEVAEAWDAIIGGARGVEWFDHDFCGGCADGYGVGTADALIDSNSAFAGLQAAVKAFNSEVTALAPVLNSPFANGYVTAAGSMNTMAKYDQSGNDFYVFAAPRSNSSQNITFTVAGSYTGPVTVYGENRTVHATNGQFTDMFANQTATHIYVIPNS
jgi:hypothetical protein